MLVRKCSCAVSDLHLDLEMGVPYRFCSWSHVMTPDSSEMLYFHIIFTMNAEA